MVKPSLLANRLINILSHLANCNGLGQRRQNRSESRPIRRTLRRELQRGHNSCRFDGSLAGRDFRSARRSRCARRWRARSNALPPRPHLRRRLPLPPLFFREDWRQITPPANAGPDFVSEGGVTTAAVTNPALELKLYDPDAASIPGYRANPPPRSVARDWGGPSCIQLAGHNQNPPPQRVANGEPTDPPNLWTGVCHTAVAATLRDRSSYVDLTGRARIRWVTRTSGFHVVRPVVKLADGNWFVGDYGEGAPSANSTLFLESEFARRVRALAAARHLARRDRRANVGVARSPAESTRSASRTCCPAAATAGAGS